MDKLLVALDVESGDRAIQLVQALHGIAGGFKVGNRLFTSEGPTLVRRIVESLLFVTDKPVYFIGGGHSAGSKPRAGYEVAVVQIQLDEKGQGRGTMAAAARVKLDGDGAVLLDDYAEEPIALINLTRKSS